MVEEIITFEAIKKVYDEERKHDNKLSPIQDDFFKKAIDYLNIKKQMAKSKNDEKSLIEVKNLERILEEIFNIRERKIVNLALIHVRSKIDIKNLTSNEKNVFEAIVKVLSESRENFKKAIKGKISYIVFKTDYHQFVGFDGKKYGPFRAGDKVNIDEIPKEFIKILKDANVIEIVEGE